MLKSASPLVSVIIPVHNRFDLADESVQSVINQSYRPIEVIIVDDFSNELYTPRVKSDLDFHVKTIRHKSNRGPGASRESGRKEARGDFIAYLDSDDLWHPYIISKQLSEFSRNPEAGMCYCTAIRITDFPPTGDEEYFMRSNNFYDSFFPIIFSGRPWGTGACLWRRSASDQIGPWFSGWTWEDYDYDFRAGCLDIKICYVPEVLCYFRRNHGDYQLSRTDRKTQLMRKTSSIIHMYEYLKQTEKYVDRDIRQRFIRLVYYQAMKNFLKDLPEEGFKAINIIREMDRGIANLIAKIVLLVKPVFSSRLLGALLYLNRRFIH